LISVRNVSDASTSSVNGGTSRRQSQHPEEKAQKETEKEQQGWRFVQLEQ
jgi:hypothetical protein